jgi:hypothetical protein
MSQSHPEGSHNHFCANRSVKVGAIFVGSCVLVLVAGWRALGRSPTTGMFTHALLILGLGFCLAVFKCIQERVVLGLSLLTPATALLLAGAPSLANWSSFAYRLDLAAAAFALVVSISMLMSTLRGRNRPSVSSCP